MQEKFTQKSINNFPVVQKRTWIRDTLCKYLTLRIEPAGAKSFYVDLSRMTGKRTMRKIGDATIITPNQAREYAEKIIAEIKLTGINPYEKKEAPEKYFVRNLRDTYKKWVLVNRKSGEETIEFINRSFDWLMDFEIETIQKLDIEDWRTKERKNGKKSASVNRELTALIAMLNWGVEHEIIKTNTIAGIARLREVDSDTKIRYLTEDERSRLLSAIEKRTDYMRILIIVAMNTGIRRGSLFALEWSDLNFENKTITLRATTTKSERMIILPMNAVVVNELKKWKKISERTKWKRITPGAFVFPSPKNGQKLNNVQTAWEAILKQAGIDNFRFHDLRHDFASRLVQKGVALIVVRDLLGHSDIKSTQKYAHLAPSDKANAVELLG